MEEQYLFITINITLHTQLHRTLIHTVTIIPRTYIIIPHITYLPYISSPTFIYLTTLSPTLSYNIYLTLLQQKTKKVS